MDKTLITEDTLYQRVDELAGEIAATIRGEPFIAIGVLTGAFMFTADLLRRLHARGLDPEIDFISAKSYGDGLTSSGSVKIPLMPASDVEGRTVLLIDDIVDTGRTLRALIDFFHTQRVAQLHTCVLLDKPSRREVEVCADFVGFKIENVFVVGYGLDARGRHRSFPAIVALDE